MSDSDKHKSFNSDFRAHSKNHISFNRNNRFTLIDEACETNLDSIRKLNDNKYLADEQYCLSSDSNNNSIQTSFEESQGLFKMGDSNKDDFNHKPINAAAPITSTADSQQVTEASKTSPSYTSIFSTNQTSNHQQQPKPRSGSRGQLRKQSGAELEEIPVATIDRLSQSKKLTPFEAAHSYSKNQINSEEDDENEDDEIDERLPFSSSMSKQGSNRRKSPDPHKVCSLPMKHSALLNQQDNRCDFNYPHHNAHTKISFNDSRPPSFNTCQFNHHHDSKLDSWREQCSHSSCGCYAEPYRNSKKSLKSGIPHKDPSLDAKYSKTRSFHLVLKSIILVLLTALLFMLFVGIILASHYLPQVFDRVLSATRSFNVTIAG